MKWKGINMRRKLLQKGLQDLIKKTLNIKNNEDIIIKDVVINVRYHKCPHYTDFTINLINFKETK